MESFQIEGMATHYLRREVAIVTPRQLAAGILGGLDEIYIKPGAKVIHAVTLRPYDR